MMTRWIEAAVLCCLLLAAQGCAPERKRQQQLAGKPAARPAPPPKNSPPAGERPNVNQDPCALRLHDLGGLLLAYYALHRQLPQRLDELAGLADLDVEFHGECPVSGQLYVYTPQGLWGNGQERGLFVYDTMPVHEGLRWGILISPPRGGQPPATFVMLLSDEAFRSFAPP